MTFTKLEFTSETLPEGDHVEVLKDYLGREICHIDISLPEGARDIDYRLALHISDNARWGYWTQLPATHERTEKLLEDGNDDVIATMADTPILMRSRGVEDFVVEAGDMLVLSQARNSQFTLPRASRGWSLRLPRKLLEANVPDLGEAPLRAISSHAPGMRLLRSYLQATALEQFDDPDTTSMVARHLADLIALPLRRSKSGALEPSEDTVSASRRKAIEADMRSHLGNPDLDLDWIAARQGVSVRHIQRLFASSGTSFSNELRRIRLEAAASLLSDARHHERTILSVALDVGFADAPTFNRSFKRHFGVTPGEIRPRR